MNTELLTLLITALIQVESGGDLGAIGDRHMANRAYGCLQIRQPCVDDVNRIRPGYDLKAKDMLNRPVLSRWVAVQYLTHYGACYRRETGLEPTAEVLARIWNGGPQGWQKAHTVKYWNKVKKEMEK